MKITSKDIVSGIIQFIMAVIAMGAMIPVIVAIIFFYVRTYIWLYDYGIKLTNLATDTIMYGTICLMLIVIIVFVNIMNKFGEEIIKIIYEPKKNKKEVNKNGTSK